MANLILNGSTSGSVTLSSPAVSGTTTLTLPTTSGTVLTTTSPKTGNVIQVVNAVISSQSSTTGTSYVESTVTASITPTSSSSKILILISGYQRINAAGASISSTIYRNASSLESTTLGMSYMYGNNTTLEFQGVLTWLDSPATTSSTAYKLYFKRGDAAGTAFVGQSLSSTSITLMEIAG